MSVRRVGSRLRPLAAGLAVALVLGSGLGSVAVTSNVGLEAAMADPAPPTTTTSTTSSTTTTMPPATTAPPASTTTTGAPATTSTSSVPRTTTVPATSTSVPQTTGVPPTSTTAPQSQAGSNGPAALAVVVSTGDGLLVRSADGTESPAQVGQNLQRGDQLSTTGATGSTGSSSTLHPATIRWLPGGTTDIYDTTPRIFVHGHKSVPRVATTISINADPTPTLRVNQGFARFWFSPAEKGLYSFVASTEAVVATVKGTDFTIGDDPATRTSTIGVTQDAVEVAPVNTSLHSFQLSAGSQVQVTPDRVGPITPLADQSANNAKRSSPSTTTTLALWLVGLLLTVAVVSGAVGLASLWRDRRRAHPATAPPSPALPPRPVMAPDLSFAHAGPPGSTGWVTLPSGPSGEDTDPVPSAAARPDTRPGSRSGAAPAWQPTHRVPPEGMKARAIPVADAGDVASLDPNQAVRMIEHRGDWANVISADGWSGWVDARQLKPEPGPP